MRVTFTLSDEQYRANDRAGIMIGLPLAVQLRAGPIALGRESGDGWFERAGPNRPLLRPFSLDRSVFHGRVQQLETWSAQEVMACQALLDCQVSLRLDLVDPEAPPGQAGMPYSLTPGDWLLGVANLEGLVAFRPQDLLWQPVHGTIVDIQRLVLETSSPDFGTLRWLQGLPRRSFLPDQVFITLEA